MSYSKSENHAGLARGESAITLDSGEALAVSVHATAHPQGGVEIIARARAIDAAGATLRDALGAEITSSLRHAPSESEITACGGVTGAQRCVLMALLGEDPAPLWAHEAHAAGLTRSSIRTAIALSKHSGPADVGALL